MEANQYQYTSKAIKLSLSYKQQQIMPFDRNTQTNYNIWRTTFTFVENDVKWQTQNKCQTPQPNISEKNAERCRIFLTFLKFSVFEAFENFKLIIAKLLAGRFNPRHYSLYSQILCYVASSPRIYLMGNCLLEVDQAQGNGANFNIAHSHSTLLVGNRDVSSTIIL